jgi:hypothetical protein
MMTRLQHVLRCARGPITTLFLISQVLVWIAAFFLDSRSLIIFMDGVAIIASFAVSGFYAPRAFKALCVRNPDIYDSLVTGLCFLSFFSGIGLTLRLAARIFHHPPWLDDPFIAIALWGGAFGTYLHLIVWKPVSHDEVFQEISFKAWALVLTTMLLGVSLGLFANAIDLGLFEGAYDLFMEWVR